MPKKAMLIPGAVLTLLVVVGIAVLMIGKQPPPTEIVAFPDDKDVESVSASLSGWTGLGDLEPVSEFTVPQVHLPRLLGFFRPTRPSDYPSSWDSPSMGSLTIRLHSGGEHCVTFGFSGKNALCFNVDGVRCSRGGEYNPVRVSSRDNEGVWIAECMLLEAIIREMDREARSGKGSDQLATLFESFDRSSGVKPPERID